LCNAEEWLARVCEKTVRLAAAQVNPRDETPTGRVVTKPPSSAPTAKSLAKDLRLLADRLAEGGRLPQAALQQLAAAVELAMEKMQAPERSQPDIAPGGGPIRIWSDGSCAPNPGPGGWGAIVEAGGVRREYSGAALDSTNNIMEMTAAIEALRHTPEGAEVHITTDSEYLKNGITQWIKSWKRNGWKTASGGAVKNQVLWRALDELVSRRAVQWHWVAGHSGHPENERCDELANQARRRLTG
jgi:ribonuclease HI